MNLTPKQLTLLQWIKAFIDERLYAPTLDEIAQAFNVSKITALQHLRALEKRGAIRRKRYQTRSIEIIEMPESAVAAGLPVVGIVQLGRRVSLVSAGERLDIPDALRNLPEPFVLRVKGRSLEAEQIADGDYLICARTPSKFNDLVVLSYPDGESLVMRKGNPGEALSEGSPAGPEGRIPQGAEPKIRGTVVSVYRKY